MNDINEDDVVKIWPLVDEADKNEVEQFCSRTSLQEDPPIGDHGRYGRH